jgi:hypothetical protein
MEREQPLTRQASRSRLFLCSDCYAKTDVGVNDKVARCELEDDAAPAARLQPLTRFANLQSMSRMSGERDSNRVRLREPRQYG